MGVLFSQRAVVRKMNVIGQKAFCEEDRQDDGQHRRKGDADGPCLWFGFNGFRLAIWLVQSKLIVDGSCVECQGG